VSNGSDGGQGGAFDLARVYPALRMLANRLLSAADDRRHGNSTIATETNVTIYHTGWHTKK